MIRRKTGRTKPPSEEDPRGPAPIPAFVRYGRDGRCGRDHQGHGGDDRDSVTITSAGFMEEVVVSNPFEFVPKRMRVVDRNGPGSVFRSRGTLADKDRIWLKTDADEGTEFTVVFWR